jgi:DNA polymerase-3 subunit alpha
VYYSQLLNDDKYKNIKIIYGMEAYECFDINIKDKDSKYFHLVLLSKNENGRKAINKIISDSNFKGFYYKPRVDLNMLKDYGQDLVVLSACLASKLAREDDYNKCKEYIKEYKSIFPYFYLEMQSHSHIDQELYNQKILQLSKDTNTEYVITTDSHSATKEDLYYQGRHVQIAQDKETMSESYEGCYLQSEDEIHKIMDKQIGILAVNIGLNNTDKVSDLIEDVKMPFQEPQLPSFPLPKEFKTNNQYLVHLIDKGWNKRKIDTMTIEEITIRKERVEYELNIINQINFDGYFLIVWDFINWAKKNNIMVGAGRGSGAGSFVCYLLGITDLDPVKYNLIFVTIILEL